MNKTFLAGIASLAATILMMLAPAMAQQPPAGVNFHLDLDTGGHRALVKDLAFTPDGDLLVSASDDKTIRVWDWRSGVTIRTIRGQIGPGNEGKVFAIAISPDGETLAAAGYFGPGIGETPPYGDVRLFDLSSGRIVAVLKGHDGAVYDLAFSPDGALVAAGGQGGFVHAWQRGADDAWSEFGVLDANANRVEKLAFAEAGSRMIVATADYGLRLFDMGDGSEIDLPDAEPLRDTPLTALAVSPDGASFAVGNDQGLIQTWNAGDGTLRATMTAFDRLVGALSYSPDGLRLVATCGYRCEGDYEAVSWDLANPLDEPASYAGHDNTVVAAAAAPTDGLVATAGGTLNEIRLWNPVSGQTRQVLAGSGAPVTSVGIAADGGLIGWGTEATCPGAVACPDVIGTMSMEMLVPDPDRGFEDPRPLADAATLRRAVISDGRWSLHYAAGGHSAIANAVLEIMDGDTVVQRIENDATNGFLHGSYTLLSDGKGVVTGGADGTMITYDRESGVLTGEFRGGHSGEVLAMAEAPAARMLVTGSADQTLKLWNLETRALVVSMHVSGTEWIVWTPQGYFHCSPNGDALVGWHVNQGQESEARFVKARQLRRHLNSPEIVRRAIITGDPAGAARDLRGTDGQLDQLLQRRPPEFEIKVAEDVEAPEGFVAIEIVGAGEAGADVSTFTVLANDRRVDEFTARSADGPDGGRVIIEVPVGEGESEILVSGINEFGYITERGVTALAKKTATQPKGKLYVIAVGINDYPLLPQGCGGRSCDLRFPVADATEFMRVVVERTAPLHAEMEALLLVNEDALYEDEPLASDIVRAVGEDRIFEPEADTISDEIIDFLDLPGPDDTTILFIAGHGLNIDEDYYVIPSDGRQQDGDRWRRSSLVAWSDIHEAISRAKGRRFMLLDTCHAAGAFNAKMEKEAADARIIVLAATAANNTAAELEQLGHGVFTHAVLEGMRGAANTGGDGVRILGLSDYIDREVRRLTSQRQEPFYHLPRTENFLVARP
jgi:WD40 repeat protein/uncharacterized caspase-like protein